MASSKKSKVTLQFPKDIDGEIDVAIKHINYPAWFSDQMAKNYVGTFPTRFAICKNDEERNSILREAQTTATLYAVLVYHIYSKRDDVRRTIDSNPELSENFKVMKAWLDNNGGRQAADEFLAYAKTDLINQEPGAR